MTHAYRSVRTAVFDEHLSASATGGIVTRFSLVAPNRLKYVIARRLVGDRDRPAPVGQQRPPDSRTSNRRRRRSTSRSPTGRRVTNVHEIAPGVLTFIDRSVPAWFRLQVRGRLPHVLHMTAAAHFMTERYVGFDGPVAVSPPSR